MTLDYATLTLVGIGYLSLLFTIAWATDRGLLPESIASHPLVYTLSLGVVAGAWPLFGSISLAAHFGYGYLGYFAGTGMLFLFDRAEPRRFWMRNTYIPLDMIFLDSQRVVVGIEENTVPLDETGRGPDQPAQYVGEVTGGYARSHGIGLGARAQFQNVP